MLNFKHSLARLAIAAAMVGACAQAAATPISMPYYHVDINTASLGTGPAFLDLYFLGLAGAPAATATVWNLSGALDGAPDLTGAVTGGTPGQFTFTNASGGGDLVQGIQLGGKFSFDVAFTMAPGDTGTTFGWALFDMVRYLGADGDLGDLFLQPNAPAGEQVLVAAPASQLGKVTAVPEPSTASLMLAAVLALAALRRRGARRL
ncbi:NF038129 family PEP-CTERM protein [Massilia pinisoli]|uniref:NF038129 family PEP-CTERM protein n=1 Tax=Massilia pinisoli TaxID=1772194 RepID=A0ABT1ZLD0_9BURK|nr:NF038129 family PEP-CTERM protein [Massilia pinisoli]MCS0580731.1 NF038129 family PEP-CTERM protein [Massilia pinisoli]